MACTVLPQLLTAHLLPRRLYSPRWLPTSSVMELNAQEDVAHMLDGTAVLMACTVLPQLLTAHLLPRRLLSPKWLPISSVMELNAQEAAAHLLPRKPWLPRWLPTSSVMELNAQEDVAHMLDGTAALMACTVLPQLLTAHLLPRRPL